MMDRAAARRPLRFAFLTTFYPPYNFGGDGIGIERLAHGLVRAGHEVTVIHDADAYETLAPKPPTRLANGKPVAESGAAAAPSPARQAFASRCRSESGKVAESRIAEPPSAAWKCSSRASSSRM